MPYPKDITGEKFGKLTAIKPMGKYRRESIWECVCECGMVINIRLGNLTSGNTSSCGCLRGKNE